MKPLPISPSSNFTVKRYVNRNGFDHTVNQIPKWLGCQLVHAEKLYMDLSW